MENLKDFFKKVVELVNVESKVGLEGLTSLIILLLATVFTILFIAPYEFFKDWPVNLTYPIMWALFLLLRILLFGSDDLYYDSEGGKKYPRAFQADIPSRHLANKFNLTLEEAKYLWFEKCFNKWRDENHPRHSQWVRTLRRGYSCRFIYYFTRTLQIVIVTALVTMAIQEILPLFDEYININLKILKTNIKLAPKLIFIIVLCVLLIITLARNKTEIGNLTGVWRQFSEINQFHNAWIDENIENIDDLKKA